MLSRCRQGCRKGFRRGKAPLLLFNWRSRKTGSAAKEWQRKCPLRKCPKQMLWEPSNARLAFLACGSWRPFPSCWPPLPYYRPGVPGCRACLIGNVKLSSSFKNDSSDSRIYRHMRYWEFCTSSMHKIVPKVYQKRVLSSKIICASFVCKT